MAAKCNRSGSRRFQGVMLLRRNAKWPLCPNQVLLRLQHFAKMEKCKTWVETVMFLGSCELGAFPDWHGYCTKYPPRVGEGCIRMKGSRAVLLSVLLFVLSGFAFADGLPGDPAIEINDPTCPVETSCPTITAQSVFTFSADANGNGHLFFTIDPKGPALTDIDIQTVGIFPDISFVQCTSDVFACDVTFIGNVTNMFFHAPGCDFDECPPPPFYPAGDALQILLGTNANGGSWQPNQLFAAKYDVGAASTTAFISTPEPSSLLLFGTGAIFALRRKLKFRKS